MIPYSLDSEKPTLLYYAEILNDDLSIEVIKADQIKTADEAEHFANFFWKMVMASNQSDVNPAFNSEYIFEKIIITLMAYYESAGYGDVWEEVCDAQ